MCNNINLGVEDDENKSVEEDIDDEVENNVRNITGLKLKYPNPFSERLAKKYFKSCRFIH